MITVKRASFSRMTARYADEVKAMSDKANEKSAKAMAAHMKRIAPKDTGRLISTIDAVQVGNGWEVHSGGVITQRKIGNRTYDRVVEIGAGKSTKGAKKKKGGSSVVFDYARLIEYGTKKRKADPYHRPARMRARKSHRSRIRRGINQIARKYSS